MHCTIKESSTINIFAKQKLLGTSVVMTKSYSVKNGSRTRGERERELDDINPCSHVTSAFAFLVKCQKNGFYGNK